MRYRPKLLWWPVTQMKNWMLIAIEIVLPGGSLIALAIFLYQRFFRAPEAPGCGPTLKAAARSGVSLDLM